MEVAARSILVRPLVLFGAIVPLSLGPQRIQCILARRRTR